MNSKQYIYSQGNRLKDRNTYFYTQFQGMEFLDSWCEARKKATSSSNEGQDSFANNQSWQPPKIEGIDTRRLLEKLISQTQDGQFSDKVQTWTNIMRKRFEVSKRVFCTYSDAYPHKPVPGANWENLELYIQFSILMDAVYTHTNQITYLNALLKCNDTLSSISDSLSHQNKQQLSILLDSEKHHIKLLMNTLGVRL